MFIRLAVATMLIVGCAAADAQVVTVTSQSRFIRGTSRSTIDGVETSNGPLEVAAPENAFGLWGNTLAVNGLMSVDGTQSGGFDGVGTFQLDRFIMNFSGGGGPDTSGTGTIENVFEYAFHVNQPATYALFVGFGCGPSVTLSFRFEGTSVSINENSAATTTVDIESLTGELEPGDYVVSVTGVGMVSYVGPGGNGSGAGGNIPIMSLVITPVPPSCAPDIASLGGAPGPDGQVTVDDLVLFLQSFFAGDLAQADLASLGGSAGGDGVITVDDLVYFLGVFFAGC